MIGWGQILYGAALSAVLAGVLLALLARPRKLSVITAGALSAGVGPVAWNAILRATQAHQFFVDAPVALLPVSWQDTGSGVFALALSMAVLCLGPLATAPAWRPASLALLCGVAAFVVDVYLY